ncbi:uncharacterized protein LOC126718179 [Quercus robur]|uniref:uncharacterized protein LOC126718179 n=1 Tax=Quercus robur TaxID=38942 RepID=UPI002162B8B4|nr:uncharacterized protein LOC126718179 [Quercus robur]
MPPRTVKRGAGSAGPKRTTRGRRRAQKAQDPPPDEVAVVAAAAAVVEAKEALKVEEEVPAPVVEEVKVEEKPVVVVEPEPKAKLVANGSGPVKNHTKWVGAFHKKQDFIDVVELRGDTKQSVGLRVWWVRWTYRSSHQRGSSFLA